MRKMNTVIDARVDDIVEAENTGEILNKELIILQPDGMDTEKHSYLPVRIEAYSIIMVLQGEMTISVNYAAHVMRKNDIMELMSHHLIESIRLSPDFKCFHIIVSNDLFQDIVNMNDVQALVQIPYNRFSLVQQYEEEDMQMLLEILGRIRKHITRNDHFFKNNIVRVELTAFLLELSNIRLCRNNEPRIETYEQTNQQNIISQFVQLLVNNCRKHSEVSFYSTELCITPEYLSRVMKAFSGKSVNVWIQQARITEAKILLRNPNFSVQQIADELACCDQSAFGKFFKKNTGKSPLEYRREMDAIRSKKIYIGNNEG